jgi:hypothetical protein
MGFTIAAALTVLGVMFRMCGQDVSRRRTKTVFWSAMALLMGFHLGGYALLMGRWLQEWKVSALVEGVAARLGNLGPMGWAGAWIVGIFCALAAWRFASRAFARVEAVPER